MKIKTEFENLLGKLKAERAQINANLQHASIEVKKEFSAAEREWDSLKRKVADIVDDSQETSETLLAKARGEGERLQHNYHEISQRLSNKATSTQAQFNILVEELRVERDEIKLQMHLASLDIQQAFEPTEKQWQTLKVEAEHIADTTKESSAEFVANSKIVADELGKTYQHIKQRLAK
jgi:hypothetical protein